MKTKRIQLKDSDYSERMIQFVLTRSNEELGELTIEKITRLLNISRSHLYQRFKREKGLTPREFLLNMKIIRAALLLTESNGLSIQMIAKKMGFSSAEHFKKVFKEHLGTTPRKYRKYSKSRFTRP